MAKVLVVGASGYIGEGVARAFRRAGYRVYGVVRKHDPKVWEHLLRNEITPVQGDLGSPEKYKDIIKECSIFVDAIYDKASSPVFLDYLKKEKAHTIENYKSLYIMTSGIMTYYPGEADLEYGLPPKDESQDPPAKDEIEMVPKKKFENTVLTTTELRTVVIRPGFVYGGHGGVIMPMFFGIDVTAPKLVIHGRRDKRWSWVHVDDLGEAYVKVAKAGSIVNNQIFNIAAPDNPTFEDLKVTCARTAGWKGTEIVQEPLPADAFRQKNWETNVIINAQKAYDLLGWKPSHIGVLNEVDLYYASWKASQGK